MLPDSVCVAGYIWVVLTKYQSKFLLLALATCPELPLLPALGRMLKSGTFRRIRTPNHLLLRQAALPISVRRHLIFGGTKWTRTTNTLRMKEEDYHCPIVPWLEEDNRVELSPFAEWNNFPSCLVPGTSIFRNWCNLQGSNLVQRFFRPPLWPHQLKLQIKQDSIFWLFFKKRFLKFAVAILKLAYLQGLEPWLTVLETAMLPLH